MSNERVQMLRRITTGLTERLGDFILGVHTMGYVDPPQEEGANAYSPIPYPTLLAMMRSIPPNLLSGRFVDYGCGMGRIMAAAKRRGFRTEMIDGVDLNQRLVELAHRNGLAGAAVGDATKFIIHPDTSVFFFGNPFVGRPLMETLENVRQSIACFPRSHRIMAFYNTAKINRAAFEIGATLKPHESGHEWASYEICP